MTARRAADSSTMNFAAGFESASPLPSNWRGSGRKFVLRVRLENVTYWYRSPFFTEHRALDGVSMDIQPGVCLALVGASGSGKTTLIQLLNGLLRPTTGSVLIDGTDLSHPKIDLLAVRRRVGLVFQFPEYQLFEETVFEDVAFGPKNLGHSRVEVEVHVRSAMERVGLDPERYRNQSPFHLSGGEKRRAAIAGVLAMDPEMLVLDEPTSGLDWESGRRIEAILADYHRLGRTVLFVTHDMDLVGRLADRIVVLEKGRIGFDGGKSDLFQDPDLLARVGLTTPSVSDAMQSFREKGLPVRTDVFTIEEAKEELRKAAGRLA
jgi:energy-coupling factor transport system ATP-binding protein